MNKGLFQNTRGLGRIFALALPAFCLILNISGLASAEPMSVSTKMCIYYLSGRIEEPYRKLKHVFMLPPDAEVVDKVRKGREQHLVNLIGHLIDTKSFTIVAKDGNTVIGGAMVECSLGWCYLDRIWAAEVDESGNRLNRIGRNLLAHVEHQAKKLGYKGVHLVTYSKLAGPFYDYYKYTPFARIPDFPKGMSFPYYAKFSTGQLIDIDSDEYQYSVIASDERVSQLIADGFTAAANERVGISDRKNISIAVTNSSKKLVGGAVVSYLRGWFRVDAIWAEDSQDQYTIIKSMIKNLERRAKENKVTGIKIELHSFEDMTPYLDNGFVLLNIEDGYPVNVLARQF